MKRHPNDTRMLPYERKETYPTEHVLEHVSTQQFDKDRPPVIVVFDGDEIAMNSQRYVLFKEKGYTCVRCGLVGTYFAKERDKKKRHDGKRRYHFNLYGIDRDGFEVMMTKDHITPRAKGGLDEQSNYQPMCSECNSAKGSTLEAPKEVAYDGAN